MDVREGRLTVVCEGDMLDGGCFFGHDVATGFDWTADDVLRTFDRFGVRAGLVGSYRCLYQDVHRGNAEAAELAARSGGRVIPLAILNPAAYGDRPGPLLRRLREDMGFRVAAVFSHPAYYAVNWDTPAVRALGEAAAEAGMALQAGIANAADLAGVARAWGHLPVPVLVRWMAGHRYMTLASEAAVARTCPHFLFDVGNACSAGAIRWTAETIGADRLFFASNSPHNIAAAPHAVFHEADLPPEVRAQIGHRTLARALNLETFPPAPSGGVLASDTWRDLCARPKVDVHWHPDGWNLGEPALDEASQVAAWDRYGYEAVILFSILALNYDLRAGNELTASWFDRDPRTFGLIVVNPLRPEESLAEIDRYADHPRFVGLKTIQDVFNLCLDDPAYAPVLERAAVRGLPVLAHLPGMDEAARRYPQVTFIAAHANWGRAQRLLGLPNVCFDFSTGHAARHETQLGRFVRAAGARRVLFGSDAQLVGPAWSLAKLLDAGLTPTEEALVLRDNARRLFPKIARPRETT